VLWRWPRSGPQARTHAILAAATLWILFLVTLIGGTGNRSVVGPIKGADFTYFYTSGFAARTHQAAALYDFDALHRLQVSVVPESDVELYVPAYPPQAALLFAPLTVFSYRTALILWTVVTIALFAVIVRSAWYPVAGTLPDRIFVIAAAAAFPPFWSLVGHGQSTIVILLAFWLGWLALERRRPLLAGMAFGLLLLKPQFAIVLSFIALACGEWAMIAGAVISVALQIGSAALFLGWPVLKAYAALIPVLFKNAALLEPKPFQMHSVSAWTHLLPTAIGTLVWGLASAVIIFYTAQVWKSSAPIRVRLGVLIFASALVNPHLTIYDATVLALPLIWIGAYVQGRGVHEDAATFWTIVYWLFVTLLAPTAFVIKLQLSVLLMIWLLARSMRVVLRPSSI
jgi:hypothetical protein